MLPTFCRLLAIASPSPGVWVDGVDGWEFGEGPMVFPVPVLLAAPEDEGPFLFRLFYYIINNKSPTCKKWLKKSSRTDCTTSSYKFLKITTVRGSSKTCDFLSQVMGSIKILVLLVRGIYKSS